MQHAEIELKFSIGDARQFHDQALRAGFLLQTSRSLERNTLHDTHDRRLLASRQILRIREYDGRSVLTHKRPPENNDDSSFYKERVETETEVTDPLALATVFLELGYAPVFRYEKYRTEFHDGEGALLIDETPIGNFAELEGTPEWIDRSLEQLQIPRDRCLTDSYGKLFLNWKESNSSPAENMTFEEVNASAVPA